MKFRLGNLIANTPFPWTKVFEGEETKLARARPELCLLTIDP